MKNNLTDIEKKLFLTNDNSSIPFYSWLILKGNPDISIDENLENYKISNYGKN